MREICVVLHLYICHLHLPRTSGVDPQVGDTLCRLEVLSLFLSISSQDMGSDDGKQACHDRFCVHHCRSVLGWDICDCR